MAGSRSGSKTLSRRADTLYGDGIDL